MGEKPLDELLADLAAMGQSVSLGWCEDDDRWECSVVTGGKRYTRFAPNPIEAANQLHAWLIWESGLLNGAPVDPLLEGV
ncbi:MAG: hypothetical protein V2A73_06790 [Pseudomonadota bacterium]